MSTWDYASRAERDETRDAYDPDDPKHPDWEDLAADRADMERKRLKEEGPMELAEIEPDEEIVLFTGNPADRHAPNGGNRRDHRRTRPGPPHRHHQRPATRPGRRLDNARRAARRPPVPRLVTAAVTTDAGERTAGKPASKPAPAPAKSSAPPKRNAPAHEKTWAGRDDYALRSMAQTRATSKAMRQPLGFIITLAGFDATPAEEMAVADSSFKATRHASTSPNPKQKKIYLLRDKLAKAGVFTIEAFDDGLAQAVRHHRVNELNREHARELIDRLEAVEPT